MNKAILLATWFFISISAYSQKSDNSEWPENYFNGFQKYSSKDVDSSMYFVRLLAKNEANNSYLQDLLHNSFAQVFQKMWENNEEYSAHKDEFRSRKAIGKKILTLMVEDSNQSLAESALPIYYWVQAQDYERATKKLVEITNDFIKNSLLSGDIYHNRIGRYALLIRQITLDNGNLDNLADSLMTLTLRALQSNPILKANPDSLYRQSLEKRGWYRYMYAYCNYVLANQLLAKGDTKAAGSYFLTSYEYSPDKIDRTNYSSYFYDMFFLLEKEKNSFQYDYINYLTKYTSDKEEVLNKLLAATLTDITLKKELETFYNNNFPDKASFATYWRNNVNKGLQPAPTFTLEKLNGEKFSLQAKRGKWVLLDFWGTWCEPCREEHPDLKKLYEDFSDRKDLFEILTIACKDDITKVKDYIKEKNYRFPVAMADMHIEDTYRIQGYPSKFLITPEGNYLPIPFGIDWVNMIKNYVE